METPGGPCDDKGRAEAGTEGSVEGTERESGGVPWAHEARGHGVGEGEEGQGGVEVRGGGRGGGGEGGEGRPVIRLLVLGGHAVGKSGEWLLCIIVCLPVLKCQYKTS